MSRVDWRRCTMRWLIAMLLCNALVASSSAQWFQPFVIAAPQEVKFDWIQSFVFQGQTEATVRQRLRLQIDSRIEQLTKACQLDETQHGKLKLAADHDLTRFFQDVKRLQGETSSLDYRNQQDTEKAWSLVSPLAEKYRKGIFASGSLFENVVKGILSEPQKKAYQEVVARQEEERAKTRVRLFVMELDEHVMLLDRQRERLIELLDKQPVPKMPSIAAQNREQFAAAGKLLAIPKAELEKLFDREQMQIVNRVLQQYAFLNSNPGAAR